MPALTGPQIKNYVRRALRELVDPSPDKEAATKIWAFFESSCAYCGTALDRERKEGHIDHLVPASKSGANHRANRVLSCAPCNESEKLDRYWVEFLRAKNPDEQSFQLRLARIREWQTTQTRAGGVMDPELLQAAATAAEEVNALFDQRYQALRARTRVRPTSEGAA